MRSYRPIFFALAAALALLVPAAAPPQHMPKAEAQRFVPSPAFQAAPRLLASEALGQTLAPSLRSLRFTITSAQLLALNATPISVLGAPGSGLVNIVEGVEFYKAAGTAYGGIASGEDLSLKYTNSSGQEILVCETTGFLDQTTAQFRYARAQSGAISAGTVSSIVPVANAAVVCMLLSGEITTGDSALKLRLFYRTLSSTL